MSNAIGDLNGKWSIMFRCTLVIGAFLTPMMITLQTWEVSKLYELDMKILEVRSEMGKFIATSEGDHLKLKEDIMSSVGSRLELDLLTKRVEKIENK